MAAIRLTIAAAFAASLAVGLAAAKPLPQLRLAHGAVQLFVDGKPFLVRGAELENSSASSAAFLATVWPRLAAMHVNTVLAPAYWELIEPQEGKFDFRSVDALIAGARRHGMRLVLLWFGSWKNSMSSYAPGWVKRDEPRFARARRSDGEGLEILSAFSSVNLEADARAFAALMRHLRDTDSARTAIMVQVENEVGMIPEARDHSAAADAAFAAPLPAALTDDLTKHLDTLAPALKATFEAHGLKVGASWAATFGENPSTDELFTAWSEARYAGEVAARGKAIYPLPLYANAALVRPGKLPGQYPSGGPLPHLFDVWHAAAPALDFFAPDIYFPNFVAWAKQYAAPGRAFFVPETGRVNADEMAANAFYAFAQLNAIGFSPYAPEHLSSDEAGTFGEAYEVLGELSPLILAAQGSGKMVGIRPPVAFDGVADLDAQRFTLGDYVFDVHFKEPPSIGAKQETSLPGAHGGLIVQLAPDEFLLAGTGMIVDFATPGARAGIDGVWEGRFANGKWMAGRLLNGDDTNQGRYLRFPSGRFTILKIKLYRYR
jgi:beta-galactosidase GanA